MNYSIEIINKMSRVFDKKPTKKPNIINSPERVNLLGKHVDYIVGTLQSATFNKEIYLIFKRNIRTHSIFRVFIAKALLCLLLSTISCHKKNNSAKNNSTNKKIDIPDGMVLIQKGIFYQGAIPDDSFAMQDEQPRHQVFLDSFLIDATEVTNAQFAKFIEETSYITVAERPVDWKELKRQLPNGTQKPPDSLLLPGSLVFKESIDKVIDLVNYSQWWEWRTGANWKHPKGPDSDIIGKEQYPVTHIAYEDALAYCRWAQRELPTEAQWEYAARAGLDNAIFTWGIDAEIIHKYANTFTGIFPNQNTEKDGFKNLAPVKSYPPNKNKLYDMSGNVWEWVSDWYDPMYYNKKNTISYNPQGPSEPSNNNTQKVIKGGSFLCNANYCASYRISARMPSTLDSSSDHKGFRTVINLK